MPRSRYDDEDDDRPRRRSRRNDDDEDDDDRPRSRRRRDEDEDDEDDRPRRRGARREDDDDFDRPKKKKGGGKTLGIVLGILGAVFLVCGGLAALLIYPAYKKFDEAKGRFKATNNMKVVVMAMHNHQDAGFRVHAPFHEDPAAVIPPGPPPGNLTDRLSWRVSLLPHMQQKSLFDRFDAKQPWNSPANQPPATAVVPEYADTDTPADPSTRTRLFYDNGALFETDRGRRVGFSGVADGTSNTLAYVESADKVGWTQFNDFRFDPNGPPPPLGKPNATVFLVAMADGSVRAVRKTVSPQTLKAAITRAGGEVASLDE